MPLSSPSISVMNLEGTALTLWVEFLAQYFDGASHTLGSNAPVTLPLCDIQAQAANPVQNLVRPLLQVLWIAPGFIRQVWATTPAGKKEKQALADVAFIFYVRTPTRDKDLCQQVAGALYGLLANATEVYALAAKGMEMARPGTPYFIADGAPGGTGGGQYNIRAVNCRVKLRYFLNGQPP